MPRLALVVSEKPDGPRLDADGIVARIRQQIEKHVLVGGSRVPSIRALSKQWRTSRHAVVEAYDRLVAAGYLVPRPGSGFYVADVRQRVQLEQHATRQQAFDVAGLIRDILESGDDMLKVGGPWLPDEWLDVEAVQSAIRALGRGDHAHLFHYGLPKGYLPLRQQLQILLHEIGIESTSEQIVLTAGTSQALDLVIRQFVRPGDTVFVEDPGYYNLFGLLRMCGANLVGIPRRPDGPDVETLRKLAAQHRPKLFLLQPMLQNPTGSDTSPHVMFRILQTAAEFDLTLVEDDTYCDLDETSGPRLASFDRLDRVIYVRSFSKTLSGSLRVGFIAASPRVADELTNAKVLSSITTSQMTERVVHGLLVDGHYRKYLQRVRDLVAAARHAAVDLLQTHKFEIFTTPKSGNLLWARLPGHADSSELAKIARKHNVVLGQGAAFRPDLGPTPWMRFNVALCGDPRLARFLRSLS